VRAQDNDFSIDEFEERSSDIMSRKKDGEKSVVIKGASLVLLVVSLALTSAPYFVPYLLNFLLDDNINITVNNLSKITAFSIGIISFFAIILFCIGTIKRFRGLILRDDLDKLNKLTNQLKISSDIITETVTPEKNLVQKSFIIPPNDINQFYKILIELREEALDNRSIRLMNFGPHPIQASSENNDDIDYVRQYYANELLFYKKKPNASIYKIVSIHTREKLEEYKTLVKKAEKMHLRKFNLGYLNIKKFDNYPPEVIGVDIISDVALFMNPEYATITSKSEYTALYIQSPEISEIYRNYHKALWRAIEDDEERGLILYGEKNGGISPKIEEYLTRIEDQINEDLKEQTPRTVNGNLGSGEKENKSFFEQLKLLLKILR